MELLAAVNPEAAHRPSLVDANAMVEELLAEAAAQRWVADRIKQIGIRSMDFRNGASMDLEPAREMVAMWVGACRGLLGDAPNYSETIMDVLPNVGDAIETTVKVAESLDRYIVTVQRDHPGAMSPHQARQRAENAIDAVWKWIADVNDGAGCDSGDLGWMLEQAGFSPPIEEEPSEN